MNNRKHCVWRVLWSKQKILKALFSKTKSCLVPFEKVGKSFSFLSFFFLFPKTKSCLVAFESVRIYLELPAFVSVSHWKHSYRPWNFRIINPLFYKQGIWCPVKGNDEPEVTELYAYHKYWTQRHGFNVGHFFQKQRLIIPQILLFTWPWEKNHKTRLCCQLGSSPSKAIHPYIQASQVVWLKCVPLGHKIA